MTWHSPTFPRGQNGCPEFRTERSRQFQILEAAQSISLIHIDPGKKMSPWPMHTSKSEEFRPSVNTVGSVVL